MSRELLQRALDALEWHAGGCCEDSLPDDTVQAIADLRAALAAPVAPAIPPDVQRDAERYRWLRDYCSGEPSVGDVAPCIKLYGLQDAAEDAWNEWAVSTNHLTETIDAAMTAPKVTP